MIDADKVSTQDSPLVEIIKNKIAQNGPITVAVYMTLCLGHPKHGYYMTRDPLGAQGDFMTAPEISQLFGEVIGVWLVDQWLQLGSPTKFNLIELGPGRGTLMADILRAAKAVPVFLKECHVHLVEMSPILKRKQQQTLESVPCPMTWHEHIETLPDGPRLIVANEFFDALPIHQYIFHNGNWHERVVTVQDNELTFAIQPTEQDFGTVPEGTIKETSPASNVILSALFKNDLQHPFAGVFIDYGYTKEAFGDTLQALKKHTFSDPLRAPGESDLTAHVNFAKLKSKAQSCRKGKIHLSTQRDFLHRNGMDFRLQALCKGQGDKTCSTLKAGANRLVDPAQMGDLFKVLTYSYFNVL